VIERVRIGHLAFGLAFLVIGIAWLAGGQDDSFDAAWLLVVAGISLGLAGLVTLIWRLLD
jgi:hypothetical protein